MSVGNRLAQARVQRGLSIEDVVERTRLRRGIIEAIEADEYYTLDVDVFIRHHLRMYAQAVGVDPQEILHLHESSLGLSSPTVDVDAHTADPEEIDIFEVRGRKQLPDIPNVNRLVIGLALAAALIVALVFIVSR